MAFNPNFYQIDRGPMPNPGEPIADPRAKYIRIWTTEGWKYYSASSQFAQDALKAAQTSGSNNVQDVPAAATAGWYDGHGVVRKDDGDWSPTSPDQQNAELVNAQNQTVAPTTAPAAPVTALVNAPPAAAVTAPGNNTPPYGGQELGAHPSRDAGMKRADGTDAVGPWVRISPLNVPGQPQKYGDMIGVDIVHIDSVAGQNAQKAGQKLQPIDTTWSTSTGSIDLPIDLVGSEQFISTAYRAAAAGGGKPTILDFKSATDGTLVSGSKNPTYQVKFGYKNGATQTFTYEVGGERDVVDEHGAKRNYVKLISENAPDTSNMTSEAKEAYTRAQTAEAIARADLSRLQATQIPGAIESTEIKNARERLENAEKAANYALHGTSSTNNELLQGAQTAAQTALIGTNQVNVAANTAATLEGIKNQNYANVLQFYRDKVGDEAKAIELTQQYFNNKALVDNNNNSLALNAGKAQVDAQTSANTQRVSLSNNRLSNSNSGVSEDLKSANDINQYLQPGSKLGAQAFQAMQAMRYANAKKYGAFDVNDTDLRYDESKLPNGIRAFMNPTSPSFATYPGLPDMLGAARTVGDQLGSRERPKPDTNLTKPADVQKPAAVPSPNYAPGGAKPLANGTPTPPSGVRPPTPVTPATAARAAQTGQNAGEGANRRPDDVLTVTRVDRNGNPYTTLVTWAGFQGMDPEIQASYTVEKTESGSLFTRDNNGKLVRIQSGTNLPSGDTPDGTDASPAPTQTAGSVVSPTFQGDASGQPMAPMSGATQAPSATPDLSTLRLHSDTTEQGGGIVYVAPDNNHYLFTDGRLEYIGSAGEGAYEQATPITGGSYIKPGAYAPPPGDPHPDGRVLPQPQTGSSQAPGDTPISQNYGTVPSSVAQLTSPSYVMQQANQLLVDPAEEERKRRTRQNMLNPQAINGLFDGAYPQYPAFFG